MSKEWVYKVSESIVFFTASTPFPWHFCHLSPLHNKDLERAERSLQLPRSQHGKPFPAWNEPPSGLYDILCAGKKKRMGEGRVMARPSSCLGRGVPGRCILKCLCIPGYFFPNQVFYHGGAPAQAVAEKHFPNCQ